MFVWYCVWDEPMDTGREGGKGMKKRKRTAAVCALILWLGISLVFGKLQFTGISGRRSGCGRFSVESPGAFLMEASTGTVIYEKDADTRRSPASVTKIMTALLIFENLENGKITSCRRSGHQCPCQIHGRFAGISGGGRETDRGDSIEVYSGGFRK